MHPKRQIRVHLAMMKTFCFSEEKSHLDVGVSTLQLCDERLRVLTPRFRYSRIIKITYKSCIYR